MDGSNASLPSQLDAKSIGAVALGAGVLGSGGGGSTYLGRLLAQGAIAHGRTVRIVPIEAVDATTLVVCVAQVGAPTVLTERLGRGTEATLAVAALEKHMGERAAAVVCEEIGGINSLIPMVVAAERGVPLLDADTMGRAFPSLFQNTLAIYGAEPLPTALCDDEGNMVVFQSADWRATERLGRATTIAMGGLAYTAQPVPRHVPIHRILIPGSYSRAFVIGLAVKRAMERGDLTSLDLSAAGGRLLCSGTIRAVDRRIPDQGTLVIAGSGRGPSQRLRIDFQTEYLLAWHGEDLRAATPDAIAVLDDETGEPISTDALQTGHRVVVVSLTADPRLTTPHALAYVGPAAFGYQVGYGLGRRADALRQTAHGS
jgi:DUF917 family protein